MRAGWRRGTNALSTRWRACPVPDAIDDLDRVARLLWRVELYQRRLLWARASRRAVGRAVPPRAPEPDDADTRSPLCAAGAGGGRNRAGPVGNARFAGENGLKFLKK